MWTLKHGTHSGFRLLMNFLDATLEISCQVNISSSEVRR